MEKRADSGHPPGEVAPQSSQGWRTLWEKVLLFLEIIGLRAERKTGDYAAQLARFKLYHAEFRRLLSANNSFLEGLPELEQKRQGKGHFDRAFLARKVIRAVADINSMVESLNNISGGRYPGLRPALDRITAALHGVIEEPGLAKHADLVLDLPDIRSSHADIVGGKMANLAEMANVLGLPTPDGFAVTTEGFRVLVEEGGLRSWIQTEHLELHSHSDIAPLSETLRQGIMSTPLPQRLAEAIAGGAGRLLTRVGADSPMAVRSSAVGEDSDLSYAGQFQSVLNVPKAALLNAYSRVVASLYSEEAIQYRLLHGIPGENAEMAVGLIGMVPTVASGVVFSRDPAAPDSGMVLIQAVHGLGVALVDGTTSPEGIHVALASEPPRLDRSPGSQAMRVVADPGTGIREERLPPEDSKRPCISDEEAIQLARWARLLEEHFGSPQDVEWAVTEARRLVLVQSRPLLMVRQTERASEPLSDYPVLLSGGEVACPGAGCGPAIHLDDSGDLDSFPEGGVLVSRRPSPKFVRLMDRVRAIVTDFGSTTGHMASLARELRIPALLNTKTATRAIPPGSLITVDAASGFVYQGEVPSLLKEAEIKPEDDTFQYRRRSTPEHQLLEEVIKLLVPLTLTDPRSPDFSPEGCHTLHDFARYIHERSYAEMFGLGEKLGDFREASYQLDVFLPVDLYLVDLGGGLKGVPAGRKVKRAHIASVPFSALLKGMLHKKIPRFGPRPIDLKGLFSIMMRHAATNPEADATFHDPCYALISDCYLNYTARVGYHFSVVDTYCSGTANKNYISILFRGGAADVVRRNRRVRAIAGILKEHGFSVLLGDDMVSARLSKASREETVAHLEMVGSLLQFFRQMDAAMVSEGSVEWIKKAFLRGDYDLSQSLAEETGGQDRKTS